MNRYEKIRMDKDAIPKAESRNRSGGKKRMNKRGGGQISGNYGCRTEKRKKIENK